MTPDATTYDPLTGDTPSGAPHPNSYWAATAGEAPQDDGTLRGEVSCDVAIIGAGYTGLACATYLAREHGIKAIVLEANRPGWGGSGRNGGFARPAIGRFGFSEMIDKLGREDACKLMQEARTALATVEDLIAMGAIDCDVRERGYMRVAHTPNAFRAMHDEAHLLQDVYGYPAEIIERDRLNGEFVRGPEALGAICFPDCFTVHPLKLTHGLVRLARTSGATVHSHSAVVEWRANPKAHILHTKEGIVRARTVVVATNAYLPEKLSPHFRAKILPVLSHILVTRPLTQDEQRQSIFSLRAMSDTRRMLHYFRLLPDGRLMFGGRGAVVPTAEANRQQRNRLLAAMRVKFPALRDVEAEYDWNGWIAITYDQMPHIFSPPSDDSIHYFLGCLGSGVSLSSYAGRVIADRIGHGRLVSDIPPSRTHIPSFPVPGLRRVAQQVVYAWKHGLDALERTPLKRRDQ